MYYFYYTTSVDTIHNEKKTRDYYNINTTMTILLLLLFHVHTTTPHLFPKAYVLCTAGDVRSRNFRVYQIIRQFIKKKQKIIHKYYRYYLLLCLFH
jgi:hypothetical protein